MIFEPNQIFIRVFSFYGDMPKSKHVLCMFYSPFALFLVHVIIFYKVDYDFLIEIEVTTQTQNLGIIWDMLATLKTW
jgi:hypothetical protein